MSENSNRGGFMRFIWSIIGIIILGSIIWNVTPHEAFLKFSSFGIGLIVAVIAIGGAIYGIYKFISNYGENDTNSVKEAKTNEDEEDKTRSVLMVVFGFTITLAVIAVVAVWYSLAVYGDLSFGGLFR